MRLARILSAIPIALLLFFITSIALAAHAESVLWNKSIPDELRSFYGDFRAADGSVPVISGHGGWLAIRNTNVTIHYNVRVTNVATGEVLSPGAQVSTTDQLKFEFVPHQYTDVSWFTTGNTNDSPYGDWISGAASPPIECLQKDAPDTASLGGATGWYLPLSVDPPAKSLTMQSGMSCGAADGNGTRTCAFAQAGQYTPVFNFASTMGKFYIRLQAAGWADKCSGPPSPLGTGASNADVKAHPYTLPVNAQAISFPLTVIDNGPPQNPTNTPPFTPALAAAAAASSVCVVGAPYSITMSATDPQGDSLRYGIDWNADGSIDQYVPGTGYVPSGTMQTASRTYAVAGSKTVKVLAQDTNGLSSSWATLSFTCADTTTAGLNENENTNTNQNNNSNGGLAAADLTLRVIPSLVRSGNTTKVNWSATGVSSCTVTAPNGDAWSTLQSAISGNISKPITGQTTYTLACIDSGGVSLTKTATVNVVPNWRER